MNDYILFGIVLFLFMSVLATYIKSAALFNPVAIVIVLWGGLLFLANFSLSGLFIPSISTQLIFLMALLFVLLGSLLAKPKKNILVKGNPSEWWFSKSKSIWILLFFIALPILSIAIILAFKIIFTEGFAEYISLTRSSIAVEGRTLIFGNGYYKMIIDYFALPIVYASFFLGSSLFFLYGKKSLFILSSLAIISYSFILAAREGFLMILIVLVYSFIVIVFYGKTLDKEKIKKLKVLVTVFIVFFIGLILWMSIYRGRSDFSFLDILMHYGITYHTLGFTLFDQSISNTQSYMQKHLTLGTALFGFPEQVIEMISRRIGEEHRSVSRELAIILNEQSIVGNSEYFSDGLMRFNAFYTILYILYIDLRLPGVIIGSFLYGFFLMRYFLSWKINNQDIHSFTFIILMVFLSYSFLMMPIVIQKFFWPFIFLLWLFFNVKFYRFYISKKRKKIEKN